MTLLDRVRGRSKILLITSKEKINSILNADFRLLKGMITFLNAIEYKKILREQISADDEVNLTFNNYPSFFLTVTKKTK